MIQQFLSPCSYGHWANQPPVPSVILVDNVILAIPYPNDPLLIEWSQSRKTLSTVVLVGNNIGRFPPT